jgi:hypothetical protein
LNHRIGEPRILRRRVELGVVLLFVLQRVDLELHVSVAKNNVS